MGAELRQDAFSARLCRVAEEDRFEPQAAADGFFQHAKAFNGEVAVRSCFALRESAAQFLDQRVVSPFNVAKAVVCGHCRDHTGSGGSLPAGSACGASACYVSFRRSAQLKGARVRPEIVKINSQNPE